MAPSLSLRPLFSSISQEIQSNRIHCEFFWIKLWFLACTIRTSEIIFIFTVRLGYSKSISWIIYLSRDYTNKLNLQMIFIWQNMVLCLLPTWYLHFEWRLNNYDALSHISLKQSQYIAHMYIERKYTKK